METPLERVPRVVACSAPVVLVGAGPMRVDSGVQSRRSRSHATRAQRALLTRRPRAGHWSGEEDGTTRLSPGTHGGRSPRPAASRLSRRRRGRDPATEHRPPAGPRPAACGAPAAAAYLALAAEGTDVPPMAADHALRRELSRRVRDDLIRLGIVRNGPAATIAGGATASAGDLIICTHNDHATEAGGTRPARWPTATCSASRRSPATACSSAAPCKRRPGHRPAPLDQPPVSCSPCGPGR